ncbi:MAG: hypothetical protein LUM44_07275 [Pyrinomonadaceae bacterium]|nr:hypothetical protein [Pyrinomonadaceae bacterium]
MLFQKGRRNRQVRQIIVVQTRQPKLSDKIKNFSIACPDGLRGRHLPVLLNFIGSSVNTSGCATGRFKCPLCGHVEVWTEHSRTKKPIRIG